MNRLPAAFVGLFLLLTAAPALAAGVGPEGYNWVHPPSYLRPTNQQPTSGAVTAAFHGGHSVAARVATGDAQAAVTFPAGAFPPARGARAVRVLLTPVGSYPPLTGGLKLDGNVYRLRAAYQPAGSNVSRAGLRVRVALVYPQTPNGILVLRGTVWSRGCAESAAQRTATTISCTITAPVDAVAVARGSDRTPPGWDAYYILALSIILVLALLGILGYVIWKNFLPARAAR